MRARPSSSALPYALAAALSATVACRTSTEIDVSVSTNVACAQWQGTAVSVGQLGAGLETKPASTTSTFCDDAGYLGTVVAVPSGADNASVAFRIVGALGQTLESCTLDAGAGCIVARRALNFIPNEALSLSVPLVQACEGVICDTQTTCVEGQCVSAVVPDPSACASQTCGEGVLTDGGVADATVNDAGGTDGSLADAAGDATLDAAPADATADTGASEAGGPPPSLDAAAAGCGESCQLQVGRGFSCIVHDGGVRCWGQDYIGELGAGSNPGPGPVSVVTSSGLDLTSVQGIVTGYETTCAFLPGGSVSCWGGGAPLALPDDGNDLSATPVAYLAGASAIAIGNYHLCWQNASGLSCSTIGDLELGAFGDLADAGPDSAVFASVSPPDASPGPFKQVSTGPYFTCVLDVAGNTYCNGDNSSNESDPTGASPNVGPLAAFVPVHLPGDVPALEILTFTETACARTANRTYCWGSDFLGSAGGSSEFNEIAYLDGGPVDDPVALAAGQGHACVLLGSRRVACWGDNTFHQLGRGEPVSVDGGYSEPAALVLLPDGGTLGDVIALAAGGNHSCVRTSDGGVSCWGDNGGGEVAPGDTNPRSSATPVNY